VVRNHLNPWLVLQGGVSETEILKEKESA